MSCIFWNCQGLGAPLTIHVLGDILRDHKPRLVFLSKTRATSVLIERLKCRWNLNGFGVDRIGFSGGLVLMWQKDLVVDLISYSSNHIDVEVGGENGKWRATGIYGFPELRRRYLTWDLLRRLREHRELPWLVGGDFNEILSNSEKEGGLARQPGYIERFRAALDECGLSDLGFVGQQFTWSNNREEPFTVRSQLDRCCATGEWVARFPEARVHHLTYAGSDHIPIKLELQSARGSGMRAKKRPFRFDATWIRKEDCKQIVEHFWAEEGSADPIEDLMRKNRECRLALIQWSRTALRRPRKVIEDLHKRLNLLLSGVQDEEAREEVRFLRVQLERAYDEEDLYWRQRSKIQWIKEGDWNTSFFHSKATIRQRTNRVDKLKNAAGDWVEETGAVENIISEYFEQIFESSNPLEEEIDEVLESVDARITAGGSQLLSLPYTSDEVTRAISQMAPLKSPGPDGLPVVFFTKFWPILGSDVISCVLDFLNNKRLPSELNATFIVLIPKIKNPERITDYRPISLCNVIYKLGSKVIANRMKLVLPNLISPFQSAFVPNRLISDNVLVAYEVNHYIKTNTSTKTNHMAIKLDISKAYDRVEWLFLRKILYRFGFPTEFVDLIMLCVSSVSFSFLFNGMEFGQVIPSRGIRQGDPLSPYLFICCTEALTAMITRANREGAFGGVRIAPTAPHIPCLLFADDTLVFGKATDGQALVLKQVLDKYARVSGQVVNQDKTTMVFSPGTPMAQRDAIHHILGFRVVDRHDMYLGMPAALGRTKKEVFGFLRDRIWSRMRGWGEKRLSRAGKEVLIKAVLQAIPSYVMSCFLLPEGILKDVEAAIRRFWWGHGTNRGMAWIAWPEMCKSKEEGGLGFRDLRTFNMALVTKQAWRIFTRPDLLISQLMRARYFPHGNIFNSDLGYRPSMTWRGIWQSLHALRSGLQRRIGNGLETSIWADPWLSDGGPCRILTMRPMTSAYPDKVADLIDVVGNRWNLDLIQHIFLPIDVARILAIPLGRGFSSDRWVWSGTKDGKYSVKSCYHMLMSRAGGAVGQPLQVDGDGEGSANRRWKHIWKLPLPPKVNFFLWRLCRNILPTYAELHRRHVSNSAICSRCMQEDETPLHVILFCRRMAGVWQHFQLPASTLEALTSPWEWFELARTTMSEDNFLTALIISWKAWERRNQEVKGETGLSDTEMIRWCKDYFRNYRSAHLSSRVERRLVHPTEWLPPANGRCKLNFDAAVPQPPHECIQVAVVARDSSGACLGWRVKKIRGGLQPIEGEALAALEAISFAKERGWTAVEFEGDCIQIIQSLKNGGGELTSFGSVLEDCRHLTSIFHFVEFKFIKRSGNMLAHALAQFSCNNVLEGFVLPPTLAHVA